MSTPADQVTVDDVNSAADNAGGADPISPLAGLINPPTTQAARQYAEQIVQRSLSGETQSGEAGLLKDLQGNAENARQMLREARQRLMQQQISPQEAQLGEAEAFGTPLKFGNYTSGDFFNSFANVAAARKQALQQQRQFEQQKQGTDLGLAEQMQNVDQNLLNAKLKIQEMHEAQQNAQVGPALRVLGQPLAKPGLGIAASQIGKQVEDELGPGALQTPQGQARMHELLEASVAEQKARAGIDVAPVNPAEKAELATQFGVPADVPEPWAGKSTKVATAMQENLAKAAQKKFDAYPAADAQLQAGLRALEEFRKLNAQTHTGPDIAPRTIGGVHAGLHGIGVEAGHEGGFNVNPLSWFAQFKPNIQQMDKLSAQLTTLAIPERGFGKVTNMDMGIFQKGMLGTDKDRATNEAIAQALQVRLQNDLDRHEFEQNYFQAHQHTNGAEAAWNKYLNDNPIFDPATAKSAHPKLNPHRQSYQEYFAGHNRKVLGDAGATGEEHLPGVTEEDRNDPVNAGLSDADIIAAQQPARAEGGRIGFEEGGSTEEPSYQKALNALRAGASFKLSQGPEDPESPASNFGLEALGGAGTAAALLALAKRVGGRKLAAKLLESPTLRSSAIGAGAGAMAGGASSQDQNPTLDVLSHGVMGAMAGPLARLGAKYGVSRGMQLADKVRGLEPIGTGERKAIEAITSDNPDWNSVASKLRADARMKVPSTLAEVGPRTQGLATTALAKDTSQSADFATDLEKRQQGANTRVMEQVNQALKPDAYLQHEQDLKTALYSKAKPLYEQAYQQFPAVQSQQLFSLMKTPSGREAAARAERMMQDAQIPIGQPDAAGSPSLQYLDYVKRAFDDMIHDEEGTGLNYQNTSQGHILRDMRGKLVGEVDQATQLPNGQPGPWQQARAQYGGDLEVLDALRDGRDDFQKLTPAELQQKVKGMSFAEKDAFRSGVAENLFQRLGGSTEGQNPAQRIASTPALQEKLGALFDKPADAVKFLAALGRESDLFDSGKAMSRAGAKGQAAAGAGPSLSTLIHSKLMGEGTAGEVSDILSTPAGPDAQAKIQRLQAAAERLKSRADLGNAAGYAGAAGVASALTPTPAIDPTQQP